MSQNILSIHDAAKQLNVATKTLRRWEDKGILAPERTMGGHRRYTQKQLELFQASRLYRKKNGLIEKTSIAVDQGVLADPSLKPIPATIKAEKISFYSFPYFSIKVICIVLLFIVSLIGTAIAVTGNRRHSESILKIASTKEENQSVLGVATTQNNFIFGINVPSKFAEEVSFLKTISVSGQATLSGGLITNNQNIDAGSGNVTGGNLLYGITSGVGLSIGAGQNPVITNTDGGSLQNIFKTITIGTEAIKASSNSDNFTFLPGTGITFTTNTATKQLTIAGDGGALNVSGWVDDGDIVRLNTLTDSVGIGTKTPLSTLDIRGNSGTLPIISLSGTTSDAALKVANNGVGDLFSASVNGTTRLRLDTNGNLLPGANAVSDLGSTLLSWNTIYSSVNIANKIYSGNAGFGSVIPGTALSYALQVNGSSYISDNLGIGIAPTSSDSLIIQSSLNVNGQVTKNVGSTTLCLGCGSYQWNNNLSDTNLMTLTSSGSLGVNTSSVLATLDVKRDNGTLPVASISGATSFASLVTDNSGVGDLLTASSSGLTRFFITQTGNIAVNTTTRTNPITVGQDGTNGNGASLTAGGSWTNGSSITFKDNFKTMSKEEILSKINTLKIDSWSYKLEPGINHIGPFAEEFNTLFGVGNDTKHISTIDPAGVSLLGVQALSDKFALLTNQNLSQRMTELEVKQKIISDELAQISTRSGVIIDLDVENATISGKLMVLGRSILSDVGITGVINSGVIAIHGLDGQIDTLAGPLRLQKETLGGVDILNGKVVIDTTGRIKVEETLSAKSIEAENYKIIGDTTVGTGEILIGNSEVEIVAPTASSSSKIFLTPLSTTDKQLAVISKGIGKFTVGIIGSASGSIRFDWWVVGH